MSLPKGLYVHLHDNQTSLKLHGQCKLFRMVFACKGKITSFY